MADLNERQTLFVLEYIKDFNASRAARDAGYSEKTAGSQGFDLLKKPEIQQAIAKALEERTERLKVDADWVLQRAVELWNANLGHLLVTPENGMPYYDLSKATPEQLAAIDSLHLETVTEKDDSDEVVTVRKIRVAMPKRLDVLALIGKHVDVRAFQDRLALDVEGNLAEELAAFRERIRTTGD